MEVRELKSFQHCRRDVDIVCFLLPALCPLCGQRTAETPCRIPPYVLPSPFVTSSSTSRSVVLRPTRGLFISHYNRVCDLHIGVTDCHGKVTEFDERGLCRGSVWPECLVILTCPTTMAPSSSSDLAPPSRTWDVALAQIESSWQSQRYNEKSWNCFDFVLSFLSLVGFDLDPDLSSGLRSTVYGRISSEQRTSFCDQFLVKKCQRAEQYVNLYRQTTHDGFVCVPRQRAEKS